MKKLLMIFTVLLSLITVSVKADSYYVNSNNVEFTEEQYNFFTNMYFDGYQDTVTQKEFNDVLDNDLFDKKIIKSTESDSKLVRGTSLTAGGRTLTISKSCSSNCLISLQAQWNSVPSVASYDVIGVRFNTGNYATTGNAKVIGSSTTTYTNPKTFSNGLGYSVLLPSGEAPLVTLSFYATSGKTAYGAYEHATTSVSLATSKKYTLSSSGQGKVFLFNGAAVGKYDNVSGVNLAI